jgi:hypothetical protein
LVFSCTGLAWIGLMVGGLLIGGLLGSDLSHRVNERPAGRLTASAFLRAQPVMLVVLRVLFALVAAATTGVHAGLEHGCNGGRLPASQSGGNPTCRVAYIRAIEAKADAETQRIDIVCSY